MKKIYLLIILFPILWSSCNGGDPPLPYAYNTNPVYTWGYVEYFGTEYETYNNTNNVFSVSLFSDSLDVDSTTNGLIGTGQFLFLEDVFLAPPQTSLATGTYTINSSGLPFTVAPGKNDTVGTEAFPIGAMISYYEENTSKSKLKFITEGTFTVTKSVSTYTINCNFKTNDKKELKGSFTGSLGWIDESLKPQRTVNQRKYHKFIYLKSH
jgi:hypothetical protein